MRRSQKTKGFLIALGMAVFFIGCSDKLPPEEAKPAAAGPGGPYQLEYETYRVAEMKPYALTSLGDGRVQLVFGIIDGGCITKETLEVKSVETTAGQAALLHLLYTLDGQPCKALFKRELKATLTLPRPGTYRIRLWVNELYHDRGAVAEKDMEITI